MAAHLRQCSRADSLNLSKATSLNPAFAAMKGLLPKHAATQGPETKEAANRGGLGGEGKMLVTFGPCCFCGRGIEKTEVDPCRVTVATAEEGKWEVWACHGSCFREKLADTPEAPGLFEPTYF
jgi:hypothetical protein